MSGDFERCKLCDEWGWLNTKVMAHQCKPAWECRTDDGDDSWWKKIYARDGEEAAEKFASYHDCNNAEYDICSGREEPIVLVRRLGSDKIERWQVSGEMVPSYRAEKAEAPEPCSPSSTGGAT